MRTHSSASYFDMKLSKLDRGVTIVDDSYEIMICATREFLFNRRKLEALDAINEMIATAEELRGIISRANYEPSESD